MTDLVEKFNISLNKLGEDDLTDMRENYKWLFMVIMELADVAPEWATVLASSSSPEDYSEPDSKNVSKTYTDVSPNVTVQFQYDYTWSGGNKTGIVYKYDDGTGFTTVTGGTAVLTYDGSGNFTGATTS